MAENREKPAMTGARDGILATLRRSLGREGPLEGPAVQTLKERMAAPPILVQPALAEETTAHFITRLQAAGGTLVRVPTLAELAGEILGYLDRHRLPHQLRCSGDPVVAGIRWPATLHLEEGPTRSQGNTSLTGVFAAVAETGSLVLLSGPRHPTTLNFLADDHVAVVLRSQILTHLEAVFAALRRCQTGLPRTVNIITGPSRTGDVEQTLQIGAHGPKRLHVILVDQGGPR
jgi:L-lactate dehydrogenase complex protein LldG